LDVQGDLKFLALGPDPLISAKFFFLNWWWCWGSNPGPCTYYVNTATELHPQVLVSVKIYHASPKISLNINSIITEVSLVT
jgi:hypothetical protein